MNKEEQIKKLTSLVGSVDGVEDNEFIYEALSELNDDGLLELERKIFDKIMQQITEACYKSDKRINERRRLIESK